MTQFEVDPDSLTAAGTVADRQGDHVSATAAYIDGVCGRTGAFSGVLSIFLGSYQETLDHARKGMTDSREVATKVRESFIGCGQDYVAGDRAVYQRFKKTFGDVVDIPPYVAPGSGDTVPAGPTSTPSGPGAPDDDEPFGLAKLPGWMNDPADRLVPGQKPDALPPWLDPRAAAKDELLLQLRSRADYETYQALRDQGYTPDQALSQVRPGVDGIADTYVHDSMEGRREQAYHDAYDQAIADGQSPEEARDTASTASAQQHHDDAVDHGNRRDVLDAGGTYKGLYDQTTSLVNHTQDIVDHAQQLDETVDDLGEYDDYEDQDEDRSAQDWGER